MLALRLDGRASTGALQWLTNGNVVIIWYTYDLDGNQFWILSDEYTVNGDTVTGLKNQDIYGRLP